MFGPLFGLVAGAVCYYACTALKRRFKYDDSLDVFGVHCVGGIVGALATGILVDPALGGMGLVDYSLKPGEAAPGTYAMGTQLFTQLKAVLLTLVYSGIGSAILYKIVDVTLGLRLTVDEERQGLDIVEHGERAYNY
jgi:Amt family ammonium transporter